MKHNHMNVEKLTTHIKSLSDAEKHIFMKDAALEVNKMHKRMQKALKRELETTSHCSRALRTTLYANSFKATKSYNDATEMLKLAVKIIL